jgi:hypothetical protein
MIVTCNKLPFYFTGFNHSPVPTEKKVAAGDAASFNGMLSMNDNGS